VKISILALMVSATLCGCAAPKPVESKEIPAGSIEFRGVVSAASDVPAARALGDVSYQPAMAVAGPLGALAAGVSAARDETRGINTIVVAVSPTLSLSVPVNQTFQRGDCVKLNVDPSLKDLLARTDVKVMSMPVGSTHVQRSSC
jgi:hypothetical protein